MGTQRPVREYPDWHRLLPARFREEVYKGDDNWVYCYNVDWEMYLIYGIILHNKDYLIEGGMPEWFRAYVDEMEVVPFDYTTESITLVFEKKGWVKNTLVFHLTDRVTENGTTYNMESIIEPSPEFLAGDQAPGRRACPQEVWMAYATRHLERVRTGSDWSPVK